VTSFRTLTVTAIAAGALLAGAAPAGAAQSCPAKNGTLAKNSFGRVWHKGASLYACTTVYGHRPRARRMGPYKPQTRVAFDGVNVAWTTPLTRDGVRSDRAWAGSADTGRRWMDGKRLIPASGDQPEREARIKRILVEDRGVAWLTRTGDVTMALQFPETDPQAIGTLPAPLKPDGQRLLVGSFGETAVAQIAATLKLTEGDGEGDECGGVNPYRLTFQASGGGPVLGAEWWGGWVSTNC
ncbi:MAG TPA: hypothetical protein VFZ89_11120, partial [Solirubrobacteraceae bacterium]